MGPPRTSGPLVGARGQGELWNSRIHGCMRGVRMAWRFEEGSISEHAPVMCPARTDVPISSCCCAGCLHMLDCMRPAANACLCSHASHRPAPVLRRLPAGRDAQGLPAVPWRLHRAAADAGVPACLPCYCACLPPCLVSSFGTWLMRPEDPALPHAPLLHRPLAKNHCLTHKDPAAPPLFLTRPPLKHRSLTCWALCPPIWPRKRLAQAAASLPPSSAGGRAQGAALTPAGPTAGQAPGPDLVPGHTLWAPHGRNLRDLAWAMRRLAQGQRQLQAQQARSMQAQGSGAAGRPGARS